LQNEIYYSLTSSDILVPSVIVDRCAVSGDKIAGSSKGKAKEKWSCNPVKTVRTPGKKGSSSKAPAPDSDFEEEDEGELPSIAPTPEETFYCRYAINSQRGLYYNLKWDRHRDTALKTSSVIPEEGTIRADWGTGKEWNVDTAESVTRAKKSGPPPKKRMKVENGGEDLSGEDVDSGSEAEFDSEFDEDGTDGAEESEEGLETDDDGGADGFEPRTPSKSKKRKRGQTGLKTPRKKKANIAQPTPHSKQAIRKRRKLKGAVNGTPRKAKPGTFLVRQPTLSFKTDMSRLPPDSWLRAMHVLHVGNRPEALPCRGAEYNRVFACVGELLEEGSGGCVCKLHSFQIECQTQKIVADISGVPGTGKTATVHTVIGELKRMAQENVGSTLLMMN
jgi:origin recognition complex subunit 1